MSGKRQEMNIEATQYVIPNGGQTSPTTVHGGKGRPLVKQFQVPGYIVSDENGHCWIGLLMWEKKQQPLLLVDIEAGQCMIPDNDQRCV